MDTRQLTLLEALKIGAQTGGEMPLFRRAKVPGLFAQRTRVHAEVANQAVADGLIEITRVETVGKTSIEWARVTPKGLQHLLDSESPTRTLHDLRDALAVNQQGLPAWVADMQSRLEEMTAQFAAEVHAMRQRVDQIARQVDDAIARLEAGKKEEAAPFAAWAQDTFEYLEKRTQVGLGTRCPLSDLFTSLKEKYAELSIKDFHSGLSAMHHANAVALLPSAGGGDTSAPEYALLDGANVYYYVARAA
jgi:hypothetical protein